jgi:Cu-processing system permease protein
MAKRISALARLVILDGLRRHALIGLILFAMAALTGGLLFFDFIPRDISRASNDFLFSITWLTGFIFLLFHGVQVMAWDSERGSLHTFLARPISRTEYALGLFAGLALLLLLLHCILGAMSWAILNGIRSSVSEVYFQHLSLPLFLLAAFGLYWIQLLLLSIILLFSSVIRGSFPVLLLSLCYYFICTGLPVVRESLWQKTSTEGGKSLGTLLQCLTAIFPDFSWLDFKTLAASGDQAPPLLEIGQPFLLSALYISIVLWLACLVYKRRDLQ